MKAVPEGKGRRRDQLGHYDIHTYLPGHIRGRFFIDFVCTMLVLAYQSIRNACEHRVEGRFARERMLPGLMTSRIPSRTDSSCRRDPPCMKFLLWRRRRRRRREPFFTRGFYQLRKEEEDSSSRVDFVVATSGWTSIREKKKKKMSPFGALREKLI